MPQATIATSLPSRNTCALPISNGVSSVVTTGDFSRPKRKYTGPSSSATASVAFFVCTESQGTTIVKRGIGRMIAMSSMAWCVAPSGPTETPACAPATLTLVSLRHMLVRICSHARPGQNIAYDATNGTLPAMAKPALIATSNCSCTPISMNRSGNASRNACMRVDSTRSAQTATTFSLRRAASTSPWPKPSRVGICWSAAGSRYAASCISVPPADAPHRRAVRAAPRRPARDWAACRARGSRSP